VSGFALPQASETLRQRVTVDDDCYASAGKVDINANISGDLVAAGSDLFISRHISCQDLML
jgi:hypothetical protein